MVNSTMLIDAIQSTELYPDERLNLVRQSGSVLLEYLGGSWSYGTAIEGVSDRDLRGVFSLPINSYLSTETPCNEVSDQRTTVDKKKNDNIFYTLKRYFELLKGSNPNILESLFLPEDCLITCSPEIQHVIDNRQLFISNACLGSHFGYANQQIKKSRGSNKKVNNPCPKELPKKSDFCWIVSFIPAKTLWTHPDVPKAKYPFRPVKLRDMPWVDLKDYHVSAVEHMQNVYRLYYYGENSKGVFRGDDMLVCEHIPVEDEFPRFSGVMMYDESEFERALRDWNSYHDWIKNRNENRWIDQENGLIDYDRKNMMHCVRLLLSGINIIKHGEPIVRFEGEARQHLMDIRTGFIKYEAIMDEVTKLMRNMEDSLKTTTIQKSIDLKLVENLYQEVSQSAWKRLFGTSTMPS